MKALPLVLVLMFSAPLSAQDFTYNPAGELLPGSGSGRADDMVYVPDMRFPIEAAPAYANSQVYGRGGSQGPGGGLCDDENYAYPWWDNYCESRSWDMPLCPSGTGHQGQDIRASTCEKSVHWVVAAEGGQITDIGTYAVWQVADSGTQHRYLHMNMAQLAVTEGQRVEKGERLGLVSNDFGGTGTSIHLHYDINQNIPSAGGNVYVPTYMSLIRSYEALIGMEAAPCDVIGPDGGVIDDFGPCATLFGNSDFWRVVDTAGVEGRYHWTNAWDNESPGNWARFTLHFEEAGLYNVEFNVVPPHNVSTNARYLVRANGEESTQEVDQSSVDEWFSLGEFDFAAGGDQKIEVYDNTGTTLDDQHITVDAIRVTRVGAPSNNASPNNENNGTLNNGTTGPGGNGTNGTPNNQTGGGEFDEDDVRVNKGCCATLPSTAGHAPLMLATLLLTVAIRRR